MSDGGAAQRSNMFKKGDVLTHVNGTDVQRLKIHQVSIVTHPSSLECCREHAASNLIQSSDKTPHRWSRWLDGVATSRAPLCRNGWLPAGHREAQEGISNGGW